MKDRGAALHRLPILLQSVALVWGATLLTVVGILSRLREASTVVTGGPAGGYTTHLVEIPVLQIQGFLPFLPGGLIVVCAGAALVTTLMARGDARVRPDVVCWGATVLVVGAGLVAILTIGVVVFPAAALLAAAAARLSEVRSMVKVTRWPGSW